MAHYEGVSEPASGLYHCEHEAAFIMFPPPVRKDDAPMLLNVVFRPIAPRARAEAAVDAPEASAA